MAQQWGTYTLEVDWTQNPSGLFRIDFSTIDGGDILPGEFSVGTFDEITTEVKGFTIRRGRTGDLGQILSGGAEIILSDPSGKYNPENTSSDLHPNVKPMRQVRITATYSGVDYVLFRGFIQRIVTDARRTVQEARLECTDFLSWMAQTKIAVSSMGSTDTGSAIGAVLDQLTFSDPAFRALDTGDTLADFTASADQSALDEVRDLLLAERGLFWINGSGVARFENRNSRNQTPRNADQSTISNTMVSAPIGIDAAGVINRQNVTKTGGALQTGTDQDSQDAYGIREGSDITSDFLTNDAAALGVADLIILKRKDPKIPIEVTLGNSSSALYTAQLTRDLNDRVALTDDQTGTPSGSYHIENLEHTVRPRNRVHATRWLLSKRPTLSPFIIDVSTIDGTDVLYPI